MESGETGFAQSSNNKHMKVLSLDSFTPAFTSGNGTTEQTFRHFKTFLLPNDSDSAATNSAQREFRRVYNTAGKCYALKSPLFAKPASEKSEYEDAALKTYDETQQALLLEEYRSSLAVSHVKGFPRVYGLGHLNNEPIMVTEYVEGITLVEAMDYLPRNDKGNGIIPAVVAALGTCTLQALMAARCLKGSFIHRDLSPRNIIIRTSERTLAQQVDALQFDICLVDLGSASYRDIDAPYATEKYGIWRFGTAEYAPPEMLTRDVEGIQAKRHSETIDTYALCSVLFLLLTFTTPYKLVQRISESPYLIKKDEQPITPDWFTDNEDSPEGGLLNTILKGITPKQADRYRVRQMYDALQTWQDTYHPELGIKRCPPRGNRHSPITKGVAAPPPRKNS